MNTRKSLAWSFSQEFCNYGLQFASSIIVARLLTPSEIGVFSLAMAANFLIASLRQFGVGSYLIREENLTHDKVRTAFGVSIVISWALGLVILGARHPLAVLYEEPGIADVMLLLSVSFFLNPLGQPAQALLTREMHFDVLHHISLVKGIVGAVTSIVLAYMGFSYMALAWSMLASSVAGVIMLLAVRRDHITLMPGFSHWRELTQFGGLLSVVSIIGTVNVEGMKFILGGIINPAAVALFERTQQLPSFTRQLLFAPVGRVMFPSFSRDIREGHSIGPAVAKLVSATTVLVWPAFLTIGFISVPLIVFLFGENWRVAGELLPYVLLSQSLLALTPQPDVILVPHGKVMRLLVTRALAMIVNVTLTVLGALHSLELFAMLRPVQTVISVTIIYFAIRAYWQVDNARILKGYARSAVIAIISAAPALVCFLYFGWEVPFWALLAVGLTAPPVWLALIFLMKHDLSYEVSPILRRVSRSFVRSGSAS